jgi:phosphatidylserine decarboxylase
MRNQKTPIALEGLPFLLAAALLTGVFAFFGLNVLAVLGFLITGFIAFFFRNPQRNIPADERAVLAPADGLVIFLGNALEDHLQEEMTKISIFMSVFNVHVNRAPVSGSVVESFYKKGKFLDVRDAKATFENEQAGLVVETGSMKMVVVQVAGLIARRIVCYPKKGDTLKRGDRYGLIRFGSRLDVYLPKSCVVRVALGDKTVAGETILGTLS